MKLSPFRLERYFAEHEFSTPYLLCCSDCESFSTEELLQLEEGGRQGLLRLRLGYTESRGSEDLRNQIAALYGRIGFDDVLVHAGAEEAIFNFMNVALQPGDHAVVHSPCYQSLAEIARGIGAAVTEWKADPQDGWTLDLGFLADAATDRTRVVVVNFPHNPTGCLPEKGFVRELARLSDERGFVVFSDEVYRGLEYDPPDRLPPFTDINDRAVSLSVMSKTYGLAGLRIGWIATRNRELYDKLAGFKDYTSICSSAPSEYLATLALRHHEEIRERNLRIIRGNLDRLDEFFSRHEDVFEWRRPEAGPIAFPRFLGESVDAFCDQVRRKAGVLLLPGTAYGREYGHVRIGFGRRNLPQALEHLDGHLQSLGRKPMPPDRHV